jgi:hypothetical protein
LGQFFLKTQRLQTLVDDDHLGVERRRLASGGRGAIPCNLERS